MRTNSILFLCFVALFTTFKADHCQAQVLDAKRYCVRAVNDDSIRKIPKSIVKDVIKQLPWLSDNQSDEEVAAVEESTVFRCMNGIVFVCNFGANIPCDARPDERSTRSDVSEYCISNPNEDAVPMTLTGRSTIFSWKCVRGKPIVTHQSRIDVRGFNQDIWTPIE